jgi:hypothetical protein
MYYRFVSRPVITPRAGRLTFHTIAGALAARLKNTPGTDMIAPVTWRQGIVPNGNPTAS